MTEEQKEIEGLQAMQKEEERHQLEVTRIVETYFPKYKYGFEKIPRRSK